MITLRTMLTLILLFGFLACVAAGDDSLPIRNIAKGAFSGVGEATTKVVQDKTAWVKLWTEHRANMKGDLKVPEIDFSKEMVIFAAMGRQRTGGYAIEISNIRPANDRLQISLKRKTPPSGAMVTQALTAPFHIVAVPKSALKPEFVEVKEEKKKPSKQ
jgi:hypothetical protein